MFKKGFVIFILLIVSAFNTSCITNVFNCPEDTLKTSSCPTEEKEEKQFLFLLAVLLAGNNNGKVPPGLVK